MTHHYHLAIVGGGLVGASLARALQHLSIKIAMIDNQPLPIHRRSIDKYGRAIGLSLSSQHILQNLGIWENLENMTPIVHIHVSDRGHFGMVRLHAKEVGKSAFGYVVDAQNLLDTIYRKLSEEGENIDFYEQTDVVSIISPYLTVTQKKQKKKIQADLIVIADGSQSSWRKKLGFATQFHNYQQSAIVTNVALKRSHHNWAYERFTTNGPVAMLPFLENQVALAWVTKSDEAMKLIMMSDEEFLNALQHIFGYRLGKFMDISKRRVFPLEYAVVNNPIRPGLILMGNAAHTLHPIAAQGFNLGLNDVASLAECLSEAFTLEQNLGEYGTLQRYLKIRKSTQRHMAGFTDKIMRLFGKKYFPIPFIRSSALLMLGQIGPLKQALTQEMMGLRGRVAKLIVEE